MVLFYSLEEAAAILGVSTAELRKKTVSGEIRAFLRGGNWRLRISEIHELARRQGLLEVEPIEPPPQPNPVGSPPRSPAAAPPPAGAPARAPVANKPRVTLAGANPVESREIVNRPTGSRQAMPTAESPVVEPPARTDTPAPKVDENEELIHAMDRYKRLTEGDETLPTSEVAAGPPGTGAPRLSMDLEPPRPPAEIAPPAPTTLDETKPVEDILKQVEAFIQEIDQADGPGAGHPSTPTSPDARKRARRKAKGAGRDWEQLLDSALESERRQAEAALSGEEAQTPGVTTPTPISGAPSSPGHGQASTEKVSEKPAVARGHFPIQCPNPECRQFGQVPIGTLYTQLKCTACSADFYVDRFSNEAVLGVRPVSKPSWMRASPGTTTPRGPSKLENAVDHWLRLSPKGKALSLSRFAALLLACYLVYFFWPRVPNTPNARTLEVIAALDRNDPGRVRAIALEDSSGSVDAWFQKVRSTSWPKTPREPAPGVMLLYSRKNKKRAFAATVITLIDPNGPGPSDEAATKPAAGKEKKSTPAQTSKATKIQLLWVKESSEWLFDGKETLKTFESSQSKDSPKTK